jgi:putative peptidoglycan lipid II flippase
VVVNIVVSLLLFGPLGHVGIAIATTVAAWVNVVLLARGLKGMVHPSKKFWSRSLRTVAASVAMGVIVWLGLQVLAGWFDEAFWKQCVALGILIGLGISAYAVLVLWWKATSIGELKAGFWRG